MSHAGRPESRARTWTVMIGAILVTAGVALHLPMYLGQASNGYRLSGMGWDRWMILGMALVVVGSVAAIWALIPREALRRPASDAIRVEVSDDEQLNRRHVALLLTLTLAVAIDAAKPFTFAFILPGVAKEYGLSSPTHHVAGALPVALYPLAGIGGTMIGSLIFGYLADLIGRRSLILITSTLFIGTSACGGMPAYGYNLLMCFLMGLAVGGLLPVASSLLTEAIPTRHRGAAVVLVVGGGTALGFLLVSWLAHWLVPILNWRVLWFTSAPMGLLLILINRFIPESPRYLLARGRTREAQEVAARFGATIAADPVLPGPPPTGRPETTAGPARLGPLTFILALVGLATGIVQYGFITWLPLDTVGSNADRVTSVLADAALFGVPAALAVAWLYAKWSSKGTLVVSALLMAASLGGFAVAGTHVADHEALFIVLVSLMLGSTWGSVAALLPYAAEIFPTEIRSGGTGLVAGAAKAGGVAALLMSVAALSPPSLAGSAVIGAVPAVLAGVLLLRFGPETRQRRLEDIARPAGRVAVEAESG